MYWDTFTIPVLIFNFIIIQVNASFDLLFNVCWRVVTNAFNTESLQSWLETAARPKWTFFAFEMVSLKAGTRSAVTRSQLPSSSDFSASRQQ